MWVRICIDLEALKRTRKEKKINQVDMVEDVFFNEKTYAKMENGVREINTTELNRICKKLDISVLELIYFTDEKGQKYRFDKNNLQLIES